MALIGEERAVGRKCRHLSCAHSMSSQVTPSSQKEAVWKVWSSRPPRTLPFSEWNAHNVPENKNPILQAPWQSKQLLCCLYIGNMWQFKIHSALFPKPALSLPFKKKKKKKKKMKLGSWLTLKKIPKIHFYEVFCHSFFPDAHLTWQRGCSKPQKATLK